MLARTIVDSKKIGWKTSRRNCLGKKYIRKNCFGKKCRRNQSQKTDNIPTFVALTLKYKVQFQK
jgi:hypothetical protein